MISQSQALSWKNFWSLTFPSYNTKYLNHIRSIMINSALIPHGVLLWWQRKTWKSVAHPSDLFFFLTTTDSKCWCAIMRSEKTHTHTLACNEFFGMQWITDAAARSDAMSDSCWYAIVRSEKTHTHTLACNEFFSMQWIKAAAARSCAMNYGCWYAIVRSEKTHTLACNECQVLVGHRAIRKDTHADMQRIPAGDVTTHADMQRIPAGDVTSYRQRRANGF